MHAVSGHVFVAMCLSGLLPSLAAHPNLSPTAIPRPSHSQSADPASGHSTSWKVPETRIHTQQLLSLQGRGDRAADTGGGLINRAQS